MRTLPRETIEELINYLAETFPKAIFTQPHLKRPLKKNVIADLEKNNILDPDKREAAIGFYTRDWAYERTLQAGAKRVNLNGVEVGTVTETEEREAKARVQAKKKEIKERNEANNAPALTVMRDLHANRKISTDMLSKVTAPPLTKETTIMVKKQPQPITTTNDAPDPFAAIQALLDGTRKALPENPDLRRAFAVAGLRVVSAACERAAGELEDRRGEFRFDHAAADAEQPY